jgi:hypothetical protein
LLAIAWLAVFYACVGRMFHFVQLHKSTWGQEVAVLVEITQNCIAENARIAQDQGEYQKRYNGLVERYERAKIHNHLIIATHEIDISLTSPPSV